MAHTTIPDSIVDAGSPINELLMKDRIKANDDDHETRISNLEDFFFDTYALRNWNKLNDPSGAYSNLAGSIGFDGSSRIVLGADSGDILYGDTSNTWSLVSTGASTTLLSGSYGSSKFVFCGNQEIYYSSDATSWSAATETFSGFIRDIHWNGSLFVAVGDSGDIETSTNGTSWTSRTSGTAQVLQGVYYGDSTWVAVGGSSNNPTITTSTDGITWTLRTPVVTEDLNDVIYNSDADLWVAVGDSGTIATSADNGTTWIDRTISITNYSLSGVAQKENVIVVCSGGNDIGLISTDGINYAWIDMNLSDGSGALTNKIEYVGGDHKIVLLPASNSKDLSRSGRMS